MKIDWDKLISCTQWIAELWAILRVVLILVIVLLTIILHFLPMLPTDII